MKKLKINPQVYDDLVDKDDSVIVTTVLHLARDFSAIKFAD